MGTTTTWAATASEIGDAGKCPDLRSTMIAITLENDNPASANTIDLSSATYGSFAAVDYFDCAPPYTVYPGYMTGGTSATSNYATWAAVTDGEFTISIDGTAYDVTAIDFSACTSMAGVATAIQTALRAETGSTETVDWSTDHFVVTSANTGSPKSAVSVTSAVSGGGGTDISGAGATDFMDSDTGNGTATACVWGYNVGCLVSSTTATVAHLEEDYSNSSDGPSVDPGAATRYDDQKCFAFVLGN